MKKICLVVLLALLCSLSSSAGTITLNTAGMVGHLAGPFVLDFQMINGSIGISNTVTLTNFAFGSGGVVGTPTLSGGASGTIGTGVVLSDSSNFFNEFMQAFTPGGTLSFEWAITTNGGAVPDEFTFAILDSTGAALPTTAFLSTGADVFLDVTVNQGSLSAQLFAGDVSRAPTAGGAPIATSSSIPEPATGVLVSFVLVGFAIQMGLTGRRR